MILRSCYFCPGNVDGVNRGFGGRPCCPLRQLSEHSFLMPASFSKIGGTGKEGLSRRMFSTALLKAPGVLWHWMTTSSATSVREISLLLSRRAMIWPLPRVVKAPIIHATFLVYESLGLPSMAMIAWASKLACCAAHINSIFDSPRDEPSAVTELSAKPTTLLGFVGSC